MEHTSVDSTNGQSCTHEAEIFNNLHDNIGTESVHLNTFTNEQASMHFEFGCDVGENVGNVRSESHALWDFGETNAFKLHDKVDDKSPNPFTGTYNVTLEPICNEELHNIQSNEYGKITLDELDGKDDARSNLPSPCLPHPASEEAQRPFSDETLNARVTPKDNPCADAQPLFCEQSQHSVSQEIESFLGEAEGQFSSQNNGRNHVQSKHTSILNCSSMPFTTAVPMVCTQMQSATATKLLPAAQNHNHVSNSSGDTVSPQALCGDMVSCFTMDKNHVENVAAVGKQRNICSRRALQTCNEIHLPLQAAHWENHRQTAAKRQIRRTIRKAMRTKAIEKNNIETGNRGQKQPIHLEPLAPSNVQQSSQNPLSSQNISTAAPDNTILPVRKVPNTSQDCPTVVVSPAAAHSVQVSPKLPKSSGKGIESTDPKTGMRRSPALAHLSPEQRKQRRAQRNREAAERSRVKKKQVAFELEQSVWTLRAENRRCDSRIQELENIVRQVEHEARTYAVQGADEGVTKVLEAVNESLETIRACKESCPRTFCDGPKCPPIELKLDQP